MGITQCISIFSLILHLLNSIFVFISAASSQLDPIYTARLIIFGCEHLLLIIIISKLFFFRPEEENNLTNQIIIWAFVLPFIAFLALELYSDITQTSSITFI
jgi:hypothetical protein